MGLGPDVPDAVADVWEHFHNTVFIPEELPKEIRSIYERGARGRCMMCEGPLMEETMLHVNALGIVAIYCGQKCSQDMDVMGWLSQAYDDLKEGVEFRGDPTRADAEPG